MQVRIVKLRRAGVEIDRRVIRETHGHHGSLLVLDVTDQGLRRQVKVARLMDDDACRAELCDVLIVWCSGGRLTLTGFERQQNEEGKPVDYAQSWLCILDEGPANVAGPVRKVSPNR